MKEPALGMIEFKSVARGIEATDVMLKKAPIRVVETHPVCPGKYTVLIAGEVGDVVESMQAGCLCAGDYLINDLLIPNLHPSVIPALSATTMIGEVKAVGVIETFSIVSCVQAADIAAKATDAQLIEIRLANGLGGKGYFVMTGELPDIEASMEVAKKHVAKEGMLAGVAVIPNPHPDLVAKGIYW